MPKEERKKLVEHITATTGYVSIVFHLDGTVSGIKPGQGEKDRTTFGFASDFQVA